jgi:hypothetical protein
VLGKVREVVETEEAEGKALQAEVLRELQWAQLWDLVKVHRGLYWV